MEIMTAIIDSKELFKIEFNKTFDKILNEWKITNNELFTKKI